MQSPNAPYNATVLCVQQPFYVLLHCRAKRTTSYIGTEDFDDVRSDETLWLQTKLFRLSVRICGIVVVVGCALYTRQHTTSICYSSVSQYINTHSSFRRGSNIYIYIHTAANNLYVYICSIAQACGFSMKPREFLCGPYEMLCVCTLYRMCRHELTSPEIHPCALPVCSFNVHRQYKRLPRPSVNQPTNQTHRQRFYRSSTL